METASKQGGLVPQLINLMGESALVVGLLSVCALAAMQSTGAAYMSTAGAMITRDIVKRYLLPNATDTTKLLEDSCYYYGCACIISSCNSHRCISLVRRISSSIRVSDVASVNCNLLLAMAYKNWYYAWIDCWINSCDLY